MLQSPRQVRVTKLSDQGREDDLKDTTAEEHLGMMWGLALAFKGEPVVEPRGRHVIRIIRGKG